jgi:uncharacterized beta-barrel protein YwiB (DUF1934 family)
MQNEFSVVGKLLQYKKTSISDYVQFYEMIADISENDTPNLVQFEVWKKELVLRLRQNMFKHNEKIKINFVIKGFFYHKKNLYYNKFRATDMLPYKA